MAVACLKERYKKMGNKRGRDLCLIFLVVFFSAFSKKADAAILLDTSLSFVEVYNDNFNFTPTDRKTDFGSFLQPSFQLAYQSKNFTLSGNYIGSLEYHSHQQVGQFSQTGDFGLNMPFLSRMFKGVDVNITENVTYTPDLPAFTFVEKDKINNQTLVQGDLDLSPGLQYPRGDTLRNLFRISLGVNHLPRFRTEVSYTNRYSHFEREDLNDSLGHRGSLGFVINWSAKTDLRTSYSYSTTSFKGGEDVETHDISAGISHQKSPLLSFSGNAGTTMVPNEKPKFTFNIGINRILKKGSISFDYTSDVNAGWGFTDGATLRQLVTTSVNYTFVAKLSGFTRLGYGDHRSISGGELDLTTYNAEAGLSLSIFSWLNGRLTYAHLNQDSKGTVGQSGHRNLVSIVFSAQGPSWRFFK